MITLKGQKALSSIPFSCIFFSMSSLPQKSTHTVLFNILSTRGIVTSVLHLGQLIFFPACSSSTANGDSHLVHSNSIFILISLSFTASTTSATMAASIQPETVPIESGEPLSRALLPAGEVLQCNNPSANC